MDPLSISRATMLPAVWQLPENVLNTQRICINLELWRWLGTSEYS